MYSIGVDPDMHHTGLAVLNEQGEVVAVRCISITNKLKEDKAVIAMAVALNVYWSPDREFDSAILTVEGQEIYRSKTKNPRNIMNLAQVAGAALVAGSNQTKGIQAIYLPRPSDWKGQVPKQIHQARILKKLGWAYNLAGDKQTGYCYPVDPYKEPKPPLLKTHWKHVVDAIGLAQWGLTQHLQKVERTNSTTTCC